MIICMFHDVWMFSCNLACFKHNPIDIPMLPIKVLGNQLKDAQFHSSA